VGVKIAFECALVFYFTFEFVFSHSLCISITGLVFNFIKGGIKKVFEKVCWLKKSLHESF